ncbi:hypothetical protein [Nocardia farcinica]|uniref:hypothetical protein n=1 Tax=Nocardia farcinica TaxID=37329 RepID=UPI00245445F8|nr:hypothetical protein [Nocardia farcinica]
MSGDQLSMDLGVPVEQTAWGKWVDPQRREARAREFMKYAGLDGFPDEPWADDSQEVKRLDIIVADLFPDVDTAKSSGMADAFICFLGECYIRFVGARWIEWEWADDEGTFYENVNPALECDTYDEDEISAWSLMNDMISYARDTYNGMFSYAAAKLRQYVEDHRAEQEDRLQSTDR